MLQAFKVKDFDLDPVFASWTDPPRFLGNPKKDMPVDAWLAQIKEGCIERKVPKEYWHKVGQRYLGDKARARLDELKAVLRNLHGGKYRWDWKKFKVAMRNMGWDIDDMETEWIDVQSKPSGFWWIVGRKEKQETVVVPVEEPKPMAERKPEKKKSLNIRPKKERSASTDNKETADKTDEDKTTPKRGGWLSRSSSTFSSSSATSTDSSAESHAPSSSGSSMWSFHSPSQTPATAVTTTPAQTLLIIPLHLVTTTTTQAPLWLLNACTAFDFLTTEHPKVMTTLSAVLITVGSLPAMPVISAGAGGALLASHAVQAAGAIAVGVGNWLKASQDAAAARAAEGQQGSTPRAPASR